MANGTRSMSVSCCSGQHVSRCVHSIEREFSRIAGDLASCGRTPSGSQKPFSRSNKSQMAANNLSGRRARITFHERDQHARAGSTIRHRLGYTFPHQRWPGTVEGAKRSVVVVGFAVLWPAGYFPHRRAARGRASPFRSRRREEIADFREITEKRRTQHPFVYAFFFARLSICPRSSSPLAPHRFCRTESRGGTPRTANRLPQQAPSFTGSHARRLHHKHHHYRSSDQGGT